jgi:integrase
VFPTVRGENAGKSAMSGYGKATVRVRAAMGVRGVRFHDLRRTAATQMAELKVPPHVIQAILNHKTGTISGVTAIYNRYGYDRERSDALNRWEERLRAILGAPESASEAPRPANVAE